jgi:hypothetical protein
MPFNVPKNIIEIAAAIVLAAFACGCATLPPPPPPSTAKLLAAGFRVVDAKTELQQQRLAALPQAKVSWMQATGKTYYVYPDLVKNQLYIGTQKEYDAYRLLAPWGGSTSLAEQHAADMAHYNKQDAMMQIYTNNDLTDPWSIWTDIEGIGLR